VLTDRVLALLLAGTQPHRLLCLTFTKAAAAEMSNRLLAVLSKWTIETDDNLTAAISPLLRSPPTEENLQTARQLFARVLDVPGGLHIETIHAFCQSLLKRFPIEAGLSPHFQVMDESDGNELLADCQKQVLTAALTGTDVTLTAALSNVSDRVHEMLFPDLIKALTDNRARIARMIQVYGSVDQAIEALSKCLGLEPNTTVHSVLSIASDHRNFDVIGLRAAVSILQSGKVSDQKIAAGMAAWLSLRTEEDRIRLFHDYSAVFLTQQGEVRKRLVTADIAKARPDILALMEVEAHRLEDIRRTLNALETRDASQALLVLGNAFLESYQQRKSRLAILDYDDLIFKARALLERQGISAWVLYKLDGGIDHVLIDEAQDTNPDQWAVIRALTLEFFSGISSRDVLRTVFVVGDAKQSIYSFQRADPAEFFAMRDYFQTKVKEADQTWDQVPLVVSFRSTQAVLDAVNALFAPMAPARIGVAPSDEDITHLPARHGQGGSVEIWPPIDVRPLDSPLPWKPPIERLRADSPSQRLATLMAERMDTMIGKQMLASRGRPIQAGDILVLVRRRGPFVEDLIRALKTRNIAVAGADRMVLTDQIAVMDLLALGAALLTPHDDLTLATVLKSPLIGLDDDALFQVSWQRKGSLWDALRTSETYSYIFTKLRKWQQASAHQTPFEFYSAILGAEGGRRSIAQRLGPEAEDPLDEFLNLALAFQNAHPPSLQEFLHWISSSGIEVKRDLEQGSVNAVRIMTVHGSKGLQAPIVFLPDTLQAPKSPSLSVFWFDHSSHELMAWVPKADSIDSVSELAKQARTSATLQEYHRLLYVAATRAEDHLIVCGWQTRKPASGTWYESLRTSLQPIATATLDDFLTHHMQTENTELLKLSSPQSEPPDRPWTGEDRASSLLAPLESWATAFPSSEPSPPRPLSPSKIEGAVSVIRSPLDKTLAHQSYQRGTLIHRLLQSLPDIPNQKRTAAAQRFLAKAAPEWEAGQLVRMIAEVMAVLDNPDFKPLFSQGSLAEVPVAGLIGDRAIAGVVDRLVVTDSDVMIVDYKTNRRPPGADEQIPEQYIRQMAAYRLALACIYPRHKIRCVLLWTDGPKLVELSARQMDDVLVAG
jgi:ATP-dependent helicase/nuclease subunit A